MSYGPLIDVDASWLLCRAKQIIDNSCRITKDGVNIWTPAGLDDFYSDSIYPRDFYYLVEACGEYLDEQQLENAIDLLLRGQGNDGRMPNSVFIDGQPWHWLYDNSQFMINLVYYYVTITGKESFFIDNASKLEETMACLPRNPETGLVYTKTPESMYGFCDAVPMLGNDLFTSLLYYEAATKFQQLYARVRNETRAEYWQSEARNLQRGLWTLYDKVGFFYACSEGVNHLPFVWGSAFAVYIGATSPSQNDAIGNWLKSNYDNCIQKGQVRHLLKPMVWGDAPSIPCGVYQNGGYWATAFAWVNRAIRHVDSDLADRMLRDIVEDFQKHGINEVVNYDIGYVNRAGHSGEYCASLVPLKVFRELGVEFKTNYQNLALRSNGGRASVSSVIDGGSDSRYRVDHINDGKFGDKCSWIPDQSDANPWLQIELSKESKIDMIIFGRDNWSSGISDQQHVAPNRTGQSDRNIEEFVIYASLDGQIWGTPIYVNKEFSGLSAGENFVVKFEQSITCRFVKMYFWPNSACIDELEIFGTQAKK
jgi:hypothetical protein